MKEFGGFLPLEFNQGNEYYSPKRYPILKVNSGRTAIYFALKTIMPSYIYVPYYICNTVCDVIKMLNIPIKRYYISEDFTPQFPEDISVEDCILVVNYFGLLDSYIQKLTEKYNNIIIDNTQAFFSEPILKKGIYNIYSCRKFIGVSDGGYLIAKDIKNKEYHLKEYFSSLSATHLLVSYEQGTNAAYQDNLINEERLRENIGAMSKLTTSILSSSDYKKIMDYRKQNWEYLQEHLGNVNLLQNMTQKSIPGYVYPLLLEKQIRNQLLEKKLYVSCLWKELLTENFFNTNEYYFSSHLITLPIDQRYNENDMKEICEIVLNSLRECK